MSQAILTPEGKKKLEDELKKLVSVKRQEVKERIQEAKEHGDLRENAEYHEAREEQSFIEGRILEIQAILKEAKMVEKIPQETGLIQIGSKISLSDGNQIYKYKIVGSTEADPASGLISCDSPIAQAVIGCQVGDEVEIELPRGKIKYQIKEIN